MRILKCLLALISVTCFAACQSNVTEKEDHELIISCGFRNLSSTSKTIERTITSLRENLEMIDIDYTSKRFPGGTNLLKRWSQDIYDIFFPNMISRIPINEGWIIQTRKDKKLTNYTVDPQNGKLSQSPNLCHYGVFDYMEDRKDRSVIVPYYLFPLSDEYMIYIDFNPFILDRQNLELAEGKKFLFGLPGYIRFLDDKLYNVGLILKSLNVHSIPDNDTTNYQNISNLFVLRGQVWVQKGLVLENGLEKHDSQKTIDIQEYVKHDIDDTIEVLGWDYFENHILGYVCVGREERDDPQWNNHFFPLTFETKMSSYKNVKHYFLLNPEKPDGIIYLDEEILGSMDANVKVLGAHFIVENDEVLKCIDPFKGEDIWWIDKEDVGEEAKILWADERGVLVYSQTNQKLYCFE